MLEDKIQHRGKFLFWFSFGGLLWIKEAEMVESVDDLKSSRSIKGVHFPNFEMLDARIASALDNIIQNSYVKKAQKEDRFLPERRIAYMIFDYSRVISAHDTVRDYADLFSVTLRNEYFKTLVRDGMKLYCRWKRSHQMMF